jgi:cell wall-associated NlpC family hydrolase
VKAGVIATLAPVVAIVLFVAAILGGGSDDDASTDTMAFTLICPDSGPITSLDEAQAANAHTVIGVAQTLGGKPAAVIAVMTALTESDLRDLGNTTVPGSDSGQGMGSDHDSVGLFQQRASWGSLTDRLDPATSTRLFVTRLLTLPGWQTMPPWAAAQAVQHSAVADGSNYQQHLAHAQTIVSQTADTADCGTLSGGTPANGATGSHGLPADYTVPASANTAETIAVAYALTQLGKPYVYGAAGPDAFDCSGLTTAAWAQAGVALPHYTGDQAAAGVEVTSPSMMSPGDLILVPGDDGTLAAPRHVGMYIGGGLVVNAADPDDGIRVQTYANFIEVGHGLSTIRHIK